MSVISFVLLVQLLAFATSHPTQSNLKPSSQQTDDFEHPAMRLTTHREKRELPNLHFDPPAAEIDPEFWNRQAINTLKRQLNKKQLHGKAKNVIFFLGDGMGLATQMATRMLKGGEEKELAFEKFPFSGLSKTYCANTQVADSACSATAYLSGVKANYGTLGLTANVLQDDCAGQNRTENHVESIIKLAQDAGMKTGIVTNTRITHATPAATYAYSANRNWENDKRVTEDGGNPQVCSDIAWQMINGKVGKRMNVILGGGRQEFLLESERDVDGHHGKRSDKNLIKLWYHIQRNKNHRYIETKEELFDVDDDVERLLGLFASNHLPYHLDDKAGEKPTLAEMVSKALDVLQTDSDDNGFMLFVEGGKIDHGHHFGLAHKALDETLEFEKAIELAQSRVDEDETLIVVSSDHSHAFTVAGYSSRGNNILGLSDGMKSLDEMPYTTLGYQNGPGFYGNVDESNHRLNLQNVDIINDKEYAYSAQYPLNLETHGGEDVGVYSIGPYAHLFAGVYEQNYIPHAIKFIACLGNGMTFCSEQKEAFKH